MLRSILSIAAILTCFSGIFAQEQPIELINPSFEDLPGTEKVPYGWNDCGFAEETPPDIHPSPNINNLFFGVDNRPQDGASYIGMVTRDNDTYEGISQRLTKPMLAGNCYQFSIYLSKSKNYLSVNSSMTATEQFTTPIVLRIYGGSSLCDKKQLLAESNIINTNRWIRFDFTFTPEEDLNYILLQAFWNMTLFPYNGHVLVDNASSIIPVPCEEEVLKEPVLAEVPPTPDTPDTPEVEIKAPTTEPVVKRTEKVTPKTGTTVAKAKINKELDVDKLSVGKKVQLKALYFNDDSAVIQDSSEPALDELYNFLVDNNTVRLEVGGHTNNLPPDYYCDQLSTNRAKAVYDYLVKKGIPKYRLRYKGYGKRNPIASNDTADGRKQNQRVEVKVLSIN